MEIQVLSNSLATASTTRRRMFLMTGRTKPRDDLTVGSAIAAVALSAPTVGASAQAAVSTPPNPDKEKFP